MFSHTLSTVYVSALMLRNALFFSRNSSAVIFMSPTQFFVIFCLYVLLQGDTDECYKISFTIYIYIQNITPGIIPAKCHKTASAHSASESLQFRKISYSGQVLSPNTSANTFTKCQRVKSLVGSCFCYSNSGVIKKHKVFYKGKYLKIWDQ